MSALLKAGVQVRIAELPFTVEGKSFPRGSIIANRADNQFHADFTGAVQAAATKHDRAVVAVNTGFVDSGKDFGSGTMNLVRPPRIGVITGDQTYANAFGEVWYYFEQVMDYPATMLGTDYINRVNLDDYDVLVFPNGYYSMLNDSKLKELSGWVRSGGNLILMEGALSKPLWIKTP